MLYGSQNTHRDAATPGFELPPMKESAVREASETNNAEGIEGVTGPKLVKEVCFNCWSAGRGKKCMLHNVDKVHIQRSSITLLGG